MGGSSEILELIISNENLVFRVKQTTSITRMLKKFASRKGLPSHTCIDFITSCNILLKSTGTVQDYNLKNGESLMVIYHKMCIVIEDENKSSLNFILRPDTKIIYLHNQYAFEKKIDTNSFRFMKSSNCQYINKMDQTIQDLTLIHNDRLLCKRIQVSRMNESSKNISETKNIISVKGTLQDNDTNYFYSYDDNTEL